MAPPVMISFQVIDKYYKNKVDSYRPEKFCDAPGCGIADLIEYKPDSEK